MALINPQKEQGLNLPEANEEEQDLYNRFILAGVQAVTETSEELLQILQQGDDPAQSLAQATLMIVPEIQKQAQVPTDALLQGSIEIMKNVAQFGKEANIIPTDDAVMNRAGQILVEGLLEQFGDEQDYTALMNMVGSVGPEEAERIGAEQEQYARG